MRRRLSLLLLVVSSVSSVGAALVVSCASAERAPQFAAADDSFAAPHAAVAEQASGAPAKSRRSAVAPEPLAPPPPPMPSSPAVAHSVVPVAGVLAADKAAAAPRASRAEARKENVATDEGTRDEPRDDKRADATSTSTSGTFVHAGTNPFVLTAVDHESTFAADVDTGSFTFARRFLREGALPPDAAVRVEEWVNAMHYSYAAPSSSQKVPFSVHVQGAPSPLSAGKQVVRIALKGREVARKDRAPTSLVFLADVSGSMDEPDKLPLAREALHLLVNQLREDDSVALVTYAGETRLALPLTSASSKSRIHAAIDTLRSGGGTNMGSGMEMAYREATKGLGGGKSARVIVLSDGDANIGNVGYQNILKSIRGYVSEGVMMSTVGLGTGNYNDHLMEQLADAGNGNYSYIDSVKTAEKVFVENVDGTLETIAQDVKIQVEWNKDAVKSYRLLGYENRDIADEDFRNDKRDAGEVGAGHAVTALYEVELTSSSSSQPLGVVHVRAKAPRGTRADELSVTMPASALRARAADLDDDGKAAVATALAAEILRRSPYAEGRTLAEAAELLDGAAKGPFADERRELAQELRRVEPRFARR